MAEPPTPPDRTWAPLRWLQNLAAPKSAYRIVDASDSKVIEVADASGRRFMVKLHFDEYELAMIRRASEAVLPPGADNVHIPRLVSTDASLLPPPYNELRSVLIMEKAEGFPMLDIESAIRNPEGVSPELTGFRMSEADFDGLETAVRSLNDQGVFHADLKNTSNIFVYKDPQGRTQFSLIDWGGPMTASMRENDLVALARTREEYRGNGMLTGERTSLPPFSPRQPVSQLQDVVLTQPVRPPELYRLEDPTTGKIYFIKNVPPEELAMTRRAAAFRLPEGSPLILPRIPGEFADLPADVQRELNGLPPPSDMRWGAKVDTSNFQWMIVEAVPFDEGVGLVHPANLLSSAEIRDTPMLEGMMKAMGGKPMPAATYDALIASYEAMEKAGITQFNILSNLTVRLEADGKYHFYAIDFDPTSINNTSDIATLRVQRAEWIRLGVLEDGPPNPDSPFRRVANDLGYASKTTVADVPWVNVESNGVNAAYVYTDALPPQALRDLIADMDARGIWYSEYETSLGAADGAKRKVLRVDHPRHLERLKSVGVDIEARVAPPSPSELRSGVVRLENNGSRYQADVRGTASLPAAPASGSRASYLQDGVDESAQLNPMQRGTADLGADGALALQPDAKLDVQPYNANIGAQAADPVLPSAANDIAPSYQVPRVDPQTTAAPALANDNIVEPAARAEARAPVEPVRPAAPARTAVPITPGPSPSAGLEELAQQAMKDIAPVERAALKAAAVAGDLSVFAKLGRGLGSKLPLIGVGLAGAFVAYTLYRAEQAFADGKITGEQLAAVVAGAGPMVATQAGSIFTGFAGEEAVEAALVAAGVPKEYRFGTTRTAIMDIINADVEIAYRMREVPQSEVRLVFDILNDPAKAAVDPANPAYAGYRMLISDLARIEDESRVGRTSHYSASSGIIENDMVSDEQSQWDRETAVRRYLATGGSVAQANVLRSGAPFQISAETLLELANINGVYLNKADGCVAGQEANGWLDCKEVGDYLISIGVDLSTVDKNHDYIADKDELLAAVGEAVASNGKAEGIGRS